MADSEGTSNFEVDDGKKAREFLAELTKMTEIKKETIHFAPITDTIPHNTKHNQYIALTGGTYNVVYMGKTYTVTVKKDEDLNEAVIKLIKQGIKNE